MAFIQLSPINADPAAVASGGIVTLTFTVTGNNGVPLSITYSIDPQFNVVFALPDVQALGDANVLNNPPPMPITKSVTVFKVLPQPGQVDSNNFAINVLVEDTSSPVGTSDQGSVFIAIK